ncbi:hypothetical protein QYM36_018405 [Artemia franciscana]|uniref:DOMON domain-containing protein n=1 Tax=Artemia franciscana TaxID=6661 RepID=A0AA88KUQ8_ARTSF|nr:hypothetical protein QYM36_018405 [Artemia franciscana]
MEDEDVCIVGIYPDGTVYINDYHAHEPSIPHLDVEEGGTEDWLLVDVSETETATTATFYRKLVTADPLNDQPILPGVARLVWSYGEADPTDFDNIILQRETTGVAQTTGFVGFGIFPENGLDNEDVCIFGLSPNGTAYLDDYHSLQPSDPKILDTTDGGTVDWFLVEISEDGNATTTTFYRKLETGDDIFFDQPIYPGEMKLIWSYGEMDLEYFDNVTFNAETTGRFDVVLIEP